VVKLAIHELLERGHLGQDEVGAFLERHAFPLAEGPHVTFVFRGEADDVRLQHWIYGLPSSQAFRRVDGTDLWFLIVELPPGSRVEYKLEVVRGDVHELIRDPRNANLAHDPFGANSVCQASGYEEPEWTREDPEARPGTIEERVIASEALGGPRRVGLYLPARFRKTRRYPLVIAHDGRDYLRFAALKVILDNMIHRLEIPPMIVALTDPGDRLREYAADERHARFLVEELLPALVRDYPVDGRRRFRALMGASFGAVAALSAAWTYPDVFGRLLLQSGSFAFTDIGDNRRGPAFEPVVEFVNRFRDQPGRPAEKLFVSCGMYESLIYENRSLVPLLQSTGMDVRYVEARDGHNWENWRDRLREGLSWLFPGPLWMVYE
jgi:enterochelin esterase family protein